MHYDPLIWEHHYSQLQSSLRAMGLAVENGLKESYDLDAVVVWNSSGASDPLASRRRLWVQLRERGWFVTAPGLRTYKIFNHESVLSITAALASLLHQPAFDSILHRFVQEGKLIPIDQSSWYQDEAEEQRLAWEAHGWFALQQEEAERIWNEFDSRLLGPGGDFDIQAPVVSWTIPNLSDDVLNVSLKREMLLTLAVLDALQLCTPVGQPVLALSPDHTCYRFLPHQGARKVFLDYWAVPVWPQGDSCYFVAPEFEYGVLSTWQGKIHFFGQDLVDASNTAVTGILGLK